MEAKKIKNRTEFLIYILAVLGLIGVINYLGTRSFKRHDMTEAKEYSVSKVTKKVLKGLDDIITIKVFFSKNLPPSMNNTVTDVKDILSEYSAFAGKNLRITWEDPADKEETKQLVQSLGIPEVRLRTVQDDKAEVMNGYLGIAVLFADKKEVIPVVQNLQNLEYDLTLAIMKVSRTSVPKIGIVKVDTMPTLPPQMRAQMKNPESTEEKYAKLFEALKSNYDVSTIDLSDGKPIDKEIKTLIVPGVINMTDRKAFEIDQFFMNGGNLIVMADAVTINFQYGVNAMPVESKLLDMLEFYGVRVEKNLILDRFCSQVQIPQQNIPFPIPVAYPYFIRLDQNSFNKSITAVSALTDVVFPWTSSLTLLVDQSKKDSTVTSAQDGVKATVLAHSSSKSWLVSGQYNLDPLQNWVIPEANKLSEHSVIAYLNGNFKSYYAGKSVPPVNSVPAGDTLSKINLQPSGDDANRQIVPSNTDGRLVVISDADFVAGQNGGQEANVALMQNLVDWLSLDNNLITVRSRTIKDRTIEGDLLKKGSSKPMVIRLVNIAGMPLLVIIIGMIIFFNRKETVPVASSTNKSESTGK